MTRRDVSLVVGIAGGSASGKTAVARRVVSALGEEDTTIVPHDAYYRDLSHLPLEERRRVNVDHPDSLETDLMVEDLHQLIGGDPVALPVYDYSTHVRLDDRRIVEPAPVLIIEGILVLALEGLRRLMDLKVYVHVPEAERLARRLARDVERRGRTPESVRTDHEWRVQPMHREFVGPSRDHADVVIEEGGHNAGAIDRLVAEIRRTLT
ncbi:MAG: uridine kinase [Gemmatimonadetes bacterium]|nr:uridine kinase [Gemmatimonadota bacterium]